MGPIKAVQIGLIKKYITFSGRASRSEFWWFTCFYYLFLLVCLIFFPVILEMFSRMGMATRVHDPVSVIMLISFALVWLALFLPSLAVTVRRLHDRNLSGWWYLGYSVVFFIIPLIPFVVWVVIMASVGTKEANRFGHDPLALDITSDVFA